MQKSHAVRRIRNTTGGLVVAVGLVSTAACAPQLRAAEQVGGPENSTWVFVNVDDQEFQGIYRCAETTGEGPVCIKAKMYR